jgi:hypothetical protein
MGNYGGCPPIHSLTARVRAADSLSATGNPTVFSRRALGIFALAAVVLAAISFAIVDVSIANASGCVGVSGPCSDQTMPWVATVFASIGTIALLSSVIPAINWFVGAMHHAHDVAEFDSMRVVVPVYDEEL